MKRSIKPRLQVGTVFELQIVHLASSALLLPSRSAVSQQQQSDSPDTIHHLFLIAFPETVVYFPTLCDSLSAAPSMLVPPFRDDRDITIDTIEEGGGTESARATGRFPPQVLPEHLQAGDATPKVAALERSGRLRGHRWP
jgi:hypothetical protein